MSRAISSALRKLYAGAAAISPVRDLFVAVTAYKLAEILFFSFTVAYAFAGGGFHTALQAAICMTVLAGLGFWGGLAFMAKSDWRTRQCLRLAAVATALCVSAAGLASTCELSLAALLTGAFPAGAAYAAKQWHEITRTRGALRESYLSFGQSAWAVAKVLSLAACAALLTTVHSDFRIFFFLAGITAATLIATAGALPNAVTVVCSPAPFELLRKSAYWQRSSFFLLESGAIWLRDLVAVSGAMTLVASAALYGWLETASSLMAAAAMAWLATRRIERPSIARLQLGLTGAIIAWLSFAGSLAWAPLFAAFVVFRAFATPVMTATYDSLVMRSVEETGLPLPSAAVARELSLTVGRCCTLGLAGLLTAAASDTRVALLIALAVTLCALPAEYALSRRLADRQHPAD